MKPCDKSRPYVFVSYKREDRDKVMKVLEELQEKYGVNIWIDTELESKGGTTWNSEVTDALSARECKCVLFFMSEHSMMSGPVLAELYFSHYAKKVLRKNGGTFLKIIPVCLSQELEKNGLGIWVKKIIPENENSEKSIQASDIQAWQEVELPEGYIKGANRITEIGEIASVISELIFDNKDTITHIPPEVDAIYKNIREYEGISTEKNILVNNSKSSDKVETCDFAKVDLEDKKESLNQQNEDYVVGKNKSSLTGDIKYALYGQEYKENQSDMMLRVFAQVLKRHQDKVATLPDQSGMNCAMRYKDIIAPNTKEAKPSYFRICENFEFPNGESVCIGTAYGSGEKMKKIARLLEICGEDSSIFQSDQIQIPAPGKAKASAESVNYTLYGQNYHGDQTEMMCSICKTIIDKYPQKLDEIAEKTLCVAIKGDGNEGKTYFRVSRDFICNGREYKIGTSFGLPAKVKEIEKVFAICKEDIDNLQIEGFELGNVEKTTRGKRKKNIDFFE